MSAISTLASRLGLIEASKLDFARSIGKRLDEHRELVESISQHTDLLQDRPWHIGHLATQDDYLMRLYFLRHRSWPSANGGRNGDTGEHVRPRPPILGACRLSEYADEKTKSED